MIYFVHWDSCTFDKPYQYTDSRERDSEGRYVRFELNVCESLFNLIKSRKEDGFVFIITSDQKNNFLESCKKYGVGKEYFKYKSEPWTNGNYPDQKGNLHTYILSADENFKDKLTVVNNKPTKETK